jgi:kynurenine formamidase
VSIPFTARAYPVDCLTNPKKAVGRGLFRFARFPLKIRGETASPIRSVAIFN